MSKTDKTQKPTINLNSVAFAVKTRGSNAGAGDTATYNSTLRRLTLGAYYTNAGWRAGAVGLDETGAIVVKLVKTTYDKTYSALHSTQHFITVVKNSPAVETLAKNRHYTITETETAGVLVLTPKN